MTQNPFDQLAKQYLEEFLAPIGTVQRQYEIPGESKFVDVWFVPNPDATQTEDLGLLRRMVQQPCLFEPYRNVPTRTEVRVSVMKLVWIQEDERRKAKLDELPEEALPCLWILAATTSKPLLEEAEGRVKADWMPGVYFLSGIFKSAIVAIDQLPETEDTLWLRVLGRDRTQERAIREVLALPPDHHRRNTILRLLTNWKIRIDLGELVNFCDSEAIMAFSEAFLEWERQTQERSKQEGQQEAVEAIAFRMLQKNLPLETISEVTGLTMEYLQHLQAERDR
ncbi:flagellar assembly protein H [Leptolyngbya sp. FACHB-17]|uniref:flagellar assembly protein H n=1 Tax=unclassified Leptolyngbya TaxID=2650499 RepID=UPI0016816367|nr:flagellar assembly protein H [Leptolyngbya sp. FACHB-17]MBD2079678.1 flagellar assembly protein H [Leptolyngbya sp. FACHB-17]